MAPRNRSVLSACGLVHSQKSGRLRLYHIAPVALTVAEQWVQGDGFQEGWGKVLDQLLAYMKQQ